MANEKEDLIKEAIKEAQEAAANQEKENNTETDEAVCAEDIAEETNEEVTEATDESQTDRSQESEDAQEADGKEKDAKKESFIGAKKREKAEKKKEKNKDKERIEELEDKVKRQLAEFENFRTRSEREKAQMYDMGAKSVLEKILPVVDNFERGLMATPEDEGSKAFVDGMNMIYKQLLTEMENMGVKPIEAVGKEFDPNFHNAVMQVESEELESGMIAQELQKGYMYRDTVIRHSMVAVVS